MALDPQNVPISFAQGVDQKTDPKQVIPGKMLVLQNASFQSPNQIQKRDGFNSLSQNIISGSSISNGVGISSYMKELVEIDGTNVYSYSPSESAWSNKGQKIVTELSVFNVYRSINTQTVQDGAFHAGTNLQIFTWVDSFYGLSYSVLDNTTKLSLITSQGLQNAKNVKVLTIGSFFLVIYYNVVSTHLEYYAINTATPTAATGPVTIATDINTSTPNYDAEVINNKVFIFYARSSSIAGYSIDTSLTKSTQFTYSSSLTGGNCFSVVGDASNNVWVTVSQTSTIYYFIVNQSFGLVLPQTIVSAETALTLTGVVSGTTMDLLYELGATGLTTNASNYIKNVQITLAGSVGSSAVLLRSVGLTSKPFIFNFRFYFLISYNGSLIEDPNNGNAFILSTTEPTYFVMNDAGQVVSKIAPQNAGGYASLSSSLLCEVVSLGNGKFSFPYLLQDRVTAVNGQLQFNTGVASATLNFIPVVSAPKLVLAQDLHIGGGFLSLYDGENVVEHGFHIYPENVTPGPVVLSPHGAIGPGTLGSVLLSYQYTAVYEWADNQGQIHQSAPSIPGTITFTPAATASIFTASCGLNSNVLTSVSSFTGVFLGQVLSNGNIPIGSYITGINSSGSKVTISQAATATGTSQTFDTQDAYTIDVVVPTLRITSKTNVSIALYRTLANGTVFYRASSIVPLTYNDPSVDTITFVDKIADPILVGNQQLYTTGGEVSNLATPTVSALTTFKNRAVYLMPENHFQWGYSKQVLPNEPLEFNFLEFIENVDQRIEKVSAAGPLDDKLILFGPRLKFFVVGDGPSPSGANNDFTEATKIAGTTGCTNQRSVIEVPVGLIYQDPQKGIWLLDRSLQEHYIGADVEQYNSFTVTSSALIPNSNKAIFTLSNGVNLIYDYYVSQWETDVFSTGAFDSTIFQNDFIYLRPNGLVLQQTPGTFTDSGALVPIAFTTGWLSFAGIEGFQRVWELQILGTYKSPHVLNITIYTDFSTTASQTVTIPVLTEPFPYQFRIHLKPQQCETMQIQLVESQPGAIGEGFSLSSLAFRVGVKRGLNKLPAGASF